MVVTKAFGTTQAGDGPVALTATSMASMSVDPPLLVFSISALSSAVGVLTCTISLIVHNLHAHDIEVAMNRSGLKPPTNVTRPAASKPTGRQPRFTEDEAHQIIQRYQTGESSHTLGLAFKTSKTTVLDFLKKHKIALRRSGLTTNQKRQASRLRTKGESLREIASRIRVSDSAMQKHSASTRNRS